ncbi:MULTISPECIES: YqcI/YcgG family protein [Burkholderia]|uniref:YqcI/YcgG family protein n=1 Tax=Burkholderia TaxID=32008 RepID=UPI000841A484|nr:MULTISPECIES: YqcI/YcgG family protein [unclassified Burkholderia]AOK32437.1 hypothetical protein AQ611_23795 [Burkholderia sp. Bp7605]
MQHAPVNRDTAPVLLELSDLRAHTPSWATQGIAEFEYELGKEKSDFPCTFGIQNYKEKSLRFTFVEDDSPNNLDHMAKALYEYTKNARNFGTSSSSLVCVFRPLVDKTVADYERWFWSILQQLHDRDTEPWPREYSENPEHETWAFCFAGEGHFVVCNTPEHHLRRSRHNPNPMITFTPRWSFKGIEGNTKPGIAVRELIRKRVMLYDKVPPSDKFSAYGQGLDWVQYFLPEGSDTSSLSKCPFSIKSEKTNHE